MTGIGIAQLPGNRLYLQHGPIDRVIGANPEARAMAAATAPFLPAFVTPMAAVAGAVADAVLAGMQTAPGLTRAFVNTGGDAALHVAPGEAMTAAMPGGRIVLAGGDPWRGVATSGRGGRSHSLGIADSVTVIAQDAAAADAAATMIANAVDLPGHPAIRRRPACKLAPDGDFGTRLATVAVGPPSAAEAQAVLDAGAAYAETLLARGLIGGAHLPPGGRAQTLGPALLHPARKDPTHA